MADAPTARQLEVLAAIFASKERRGFPPTIRELCDQLEMSSTNAMNDHLVALIKKGLLERAKQSARSLRITRLGLDYLTARAA